MMVQNSLLCAARTRFECAHRQEFEVVLCAARSVFCAFSTQKPVCVCCAHTP
ncbi:hypothetical protein V7x_00990 [Crateriforma conspicua]|uniref:Uncharacterized protein n=1 Tax=Crateriforma conspicua TaxID=2527996 RepID=A0A5C6FSP2_9PLAN|nr:hypothetical protein V7x_00990 [Crateriforma conspicua]